MCCAFPVVDIDRAELVKDTQLTKNGPDMKSNVQKEQNQSEILQGGRVSMTKQDRSCSREDGIDLSQQQVD